MEREFVGWDEPPAVEGDAVGFAEVVLVVLRFLFEARPVNLVRFGANPEDMVVRVGIRGTIWVRNFGGRVIYEIAPGFSSVE